MTGIFPDNDIQDILIFSIRFIQRESWILNIRADFDSCEPGRVNGCFGRILMYNGVIVCWLKSRLPSIVKD
jgi:hypothetical protein